MATFYEKNKEAVKEKSKQWYLANIEKVKKYKREYYLRKRPQVKKHPADKSVSEIAGILEIKKEAIWWNIKKGNLKAYKTEKLYYISEQDLEDFIQSRIPKYNGREKEYRKEYRKQYYYRNKEAGKLTVEILQRVYEDNIKKFGTLTCYLCNKPIKFGKDTLEHKIPLSRNGTNYYNNLEIACKSCNSRKKDKTPKEFQVMLQKEEEVCLI
jgi:5-methylcytosine-specific restriction endonuclease McrA